MFLFRNGLHICECCCPVAGISSVFLFVLCFANCQNIWSFFFNCCICFKDLWFIVFDETMLFEVIRNHAPNDYALPATSSGCSSTCPSHSASWGHEPNSLNLGQSISLKWPVNVQVKDSRASCFLPELERKAWEELRYVAHQAFSSKPLASCQCKGKKAPGDIKSAASCAYKYQVNKPSLMLM